MDDVPQIEPPRRVKYCLPVILFLATCLSTYWTGAVDWHPLAHLSTRDVFRPMATNWLTGLLYMGLVLGILLMHEMGHFLMTRLHRIPASLPYFIPLPVVPFGTLGAVIGMDGAQANRRKLFDMGVAGPLAGLAVTLPVLWVGIRSLKLTPPLAGDLCFHNPLIVQYLIAWCKPGYPMPDVLVLNQFNAFLMAGWVGVFVTGLNMMPVSQFDGGHVAYALLGTRSHVLSKALIVATVVYMVVSDTYFLIAIFLLVLLLGPEHPPTADDRAPMSWPRLAIGWLSLLIPIFCFPPAGIGIFGR
ncbi:MAG: site-2 protease family protein [Thermoguttaceae bacterium]